MKNTESKNRITSIYPSPSILTPTAEDVLKLELQLEIKRVEKQLDEDFLLDQFSHEPDDKTFQTESKKLKIILNKLTCLNKVKTTKLENLKSLLLTKKKELENPAAAQRLTDTHEKIQKLELRVQESETEIKMQVGETEILQEMKNKVATEIIIFKERMEKEVKTMKKAQDRFEKEKIFSDLIKMQNSAIQMTLQETKKSFQRTKEDFEKEYSKMQKTKQIQDEEIKKAIKKISKANLKQRENETAITRIHQSLENYTSEKFERSLKVQTSSLKISKIREQLKLIQSYCSDCPNFSEPLTGRDIQFMVTSYSKLKFQEHSLSLKFQNLTEEQQEKQKKCDLIHHELQKIKEDEELEQKTKSFHKITFNEMKSLLADQQIVEKTEIFEESQKFLLKIYQKLLSLSGFASKSLGTIGQYTKFHFHDNGLLLAMDEIKSLQKSPKNSSTGTLIRRKPTKAFERKKTYKTDWDIFEDVQSTRLNVRKIKEIMKKFMDRLMENHRFGAEKPSFELIDINECALMIHHDQLACFFLEINEFSTKLMDSMTEPFKLITEIHKIGSKIYLNRSQSLIRALADMLQWTKSKTSDLKSEIFEFYKQFDPQMLDMLDKGLNNKIPYKLLVKYLQENSEKFESKQKRSSVESISHVFSAKSSDQQSVKSRAELPTADKTIRQKPGFHFDWAHLNNNADRKEFEERIKSYSSKNLLGERRVQTVSASYNSIGSLRSSFRKSNVQ